jgi:hypothetical protein
LNGRDSSWLISGVGTLKWAPELLGPSAVLGYYSQAVIFWFFFSGIFGLRDTADAKFLFLLLSEVGSDAKTAV